MKGLIAGFTAFGFSLSPFFLAPSFNQEVVQVERGEILAQESLDLGSRDQDSWVSGVMADNILLTLHYLKGDFGNEEIDWEEIRKPFYASFRLEPSEVFAFHDAVLPEFKGKVVKTTGATFQASEGFRNDGYLFGDGVCHLASLMNWVAFQAGLEVIAAVNHDFRPIPGVSKEFGTAIYYLEGEVLGSQLQNLYIKNTLDFPIVLSFTVNDREVTLRVSRKMV